MTDVSSLISISGDKFVRHDSFVKGFTAKKMSATMTGVSRSPQNALLERLKAIPDGEVTSTAKRAGLPLRHLMRLRAGQSLDVRMSTLEKLAKGLGEPLGSLVTEAPPIMIAFSEREPSDYRAPSPAPAPPKGDDWHQLPKVAFAAAGSPIHDVIRKDETVWYAFHRSWVGRRAGKNAHEDEERLIVVQVDKKHLGESMIPTVRPGALLVVDRGPRGQGIASAAELKPGRLYLVNVEGGLTVKRVLPSEGTLILVSDNPDRTAYPPKVVTMKGRTLQKVVIGRVIWIGHEEE
jgi:hypothetical protein